MDGKPRVLILILNLQAYEYNRVGLESRGNIRWFTLKIIKIINTATRSQY